MSKRADTARARSLASPAAKDPVGGRDRAQDDNLTRGKKIIYLVTEDWYFCSHRLPIARAARDAGMDVVVATRVEQHEDQITKEGFRLAALPWRRRSKNPFLELSAFVRLLELYRKENPDLVHHVAMKPVLYGSAAALLARVKRQVNAVAGFGYVFTSPSPKARLLRPVFRSVFRGIMNKPGSCVIVQNPDDRDALAGAQMKVSGKIRMIKGSGVDTERFAPGPEPGGMATVTLVSRMLWSKGVAEFVDAARLLKKRRSRARFWLVGDPDPENPESVPLSTLRRWHEEGVVEWKGHVDDVLTVWAQTNLAVLPSYREGLPKTMLEAAACGLAAVATDVPGCREIVRHGENGYLVPPRDPNALADAIDRLLADGPLRKRMGERGRQLTLEQFSEGRVVEQTLSLYREALSAPEVRR